MMTKNEFMIKLQEALENDLDASAVRDNVNYYIVAGVIILMTRYVKVAVKRRYWMSWEIHG